MIKLYSINLEPLKKYDIEHSSLLKKMDKDVLIYRYVSEDFLDFVKEPTNDEKFEIGKTYVVSKGDEKIGIVGTSKTEDEGIVQLWYAVSQYYRCKGYGEKILVQVTQYLLDECYSEVNDVELIIDNENVNCIEQVENNGFTLKNEESKKKVYRYFN